MHRIFPAATINYGLGSNDPEDLAYYNKIRKEMDDIKKKLLEERYLSIGITSKK